MRERCDFHRSTIAIIGNAFIDYTVFIPRIRTRIAIAAHAHRSRNLKRFHRLYSVHSHRSVIAASHTHRSRSARASQSQLEIKLKQMIEYMGREATASTAIYNATESARPYGDTVYIWLSLIVVLVCVILLVGLIVVVRDTCCEKRRSQEPIIG
jgi:Flp pilus assembly protein TadB